MFENDTADNFAANKEVCTCDTGSLKDKHSFSIDANDLQLGILDCISCGIIAYSLPDRKLIIVNDMAKRIIGCGTFDDPIAVLKDFLINKIVPEDRARVMQAQNFLKKNGDSQIQDYRAVINGKTVYVNSTVKYLEHQNGQPYILVTLVDTTEQATLTRMIEKERKSYRDALANGSEFSFLFDVTDGVIGEEFVTSQGVNLIKEMGFSIPAPFDELLQKYVEVCKIEFLTEEMKANFTCKGLTDAFNKGKTNVITEFYNPQKDVFFRVSCLLSLDDDTGHIHASVVADDVTDIRKKDKQMADEIKAAFDETNVRLNAILDGISGGFKIADINDDFSYSYISDGAARLQGYTVKEFLEKFGERVTNNICKEDGELALAEALRQITETGCYAVKYRIPHKDGSIKWVIDRGKYVEDAKTGKRWLYILMQDVTELENRNIQLGNAIAMQKNMSDSLGSGIFAYTLPDRHVLLLNKEAKKMFDCLGADADNFGFDLMSKVIPEDMPQLRDAVKRLVAPGDSAEYVFHSDSVTGERKTFKCTTRLLEFSDGQKYILSALTDITDQERAEQRLEEERRLYRDALVFGSSGVFTVDLTYGMIDRPVYTEQGENLMEKLGVVLPASYDTFAAEWLSDKRIAADGEQVFAAFSAEKLLKAFDNGTYVLNVEYRVLESGRYYHLIILLYKTNGHNYATFIVYDVTTDRHLENQRRNIITSLGKMYMALYSVSLKDDRCAFIKACEDIYSDFGEQSAYSEFCNVYVNSYVEMEYEETVAKFLAPETIKAALADSDTVSVEFKRKVLGWCRITLVVAERDADGVVTDFVFAGTIVEKQKREELAKQEALKTAYESANIANEAKTNFLANMSHDIRTPMNAIIGMTAIAATHLDERERLSDCLSKISVSSKHLLGIINEVLDMSKIESGKIEMQEEEFSIVDLIENLLVMSKSEIASKNHKLTVTVGGIAHENVIGDSQRLQQVFMNLMSNAIKYTPSGGNIKFIVNEKQTNKPNIGCYELIVEDNGIGMSSNTVQHIFEPFSRAADDSRLDKIQGTGLGMSITKSILQMMNGDIKVESELNKGTKFTATFFLALNSDSCEVINEKFANLPILVADDDENSCIYACDLLKEIGMTGEWVLTGKEAVRRAVERHNAGNDFFAVILDWKMPDMDGVATAKEIRSRIGKDIPIIIISAYDWLDVELEARAAGVNAFISKPMFKSRVVHIFNELMHNDKDKKTATTLDDFADADFSGKRVLLVEDNSLNAEIAGEILGMAGFDIEYAVNGKEAVDIMEAVSDGYFDIIFMDIQMPILNGYEATRAIRSLPGDYVKSVPIFAMTANAFAEDVTLAKSAGMNDHIAKPLDFDRLMQVIKRWLLK